MRQTEATDSTMTPKQQIDRLLKPGYTYRNLNPFEVLQVDPDLSIDEIKKKFRVGRVPTIGSMKKKKKMFCDLPFVWKRIYLLILFLFQRLSILVHPDKNPLDLERAQVPYFLPVLQSTGTVFYTSVAYPASPPLLFHISSPPWLLLRLRLDNNTFIKIDSKKIKFKWAKTNFLIRFFIYRYLLFWEIQIANAKAVMFLIINQSYTVKCSPHFFVREFMLVCLVTSVGKPVIFA